MDSSQDEMILAQEQGVINRGVGLANEVQTGFDVSGKESEGTLLLTNKRLVYVHGGEKREDIPVGVLSEKAIYFADVESLEGIQQDPLNLTIELSSVVKVTGHKRFAMDPKLVVAWSSSTGPKTNEFIQQVTGGSRKKNLNDWAAVVERLKAGTQKLTPVGSAPSEDTLEGKILRILGDMQEKGELTIENEVEKAYSIELEPDDVRAACQALTTGGLVKSSTASGEPPFYQKISPLGADRLDA